MLKNDLILTGAQQDLAEKDHRFLWHPFTQMEEWLREEPLIIARGKGEFLYDIQGREYIDAASSIWCNVHGHNHCSLNRAIAWQLEKLSHSTLLGLSNIPSILLAEKLVSLVPQGLSRVFYGDSGAAAVEAALKMAVQFWHLRGEERTAFLALDGAYHGDTFGSMSVGYAESFHRPFSSMLFSVCRFPPPYLIQQKSRMARDCSRRAVPQDEAEEKSLLQVQEILSAEGERLAGCIVEPLVQGAAGIWPHSPSFLRKLFDLVKSSSLLFIADEVAVGFGRTGTLFACEQAGISPDLLCLGKGLGGGYLPLSATVTTEEIFSTFLAPYEEHKQLFHGHTFSGNPVACAAGLANLHLFEEGQTIEKLQEKIRLLWCLLKEKFEPHPHVQEIRGSGFFVGIEVGKTKEEGYPLEFRAGKRVMMAARRRGIILRPLLDTIVLAPPLSVSRETLQRLLDSLLDAVEEACP